MAEDRSVFIIGQGVKSPWYVGNTCQGLLARFGSSRVIDTPISENAMTGVAVGAAIVGMRPVVVHPRMDFMLYAMDPIINEAANWSYMSGGRSGAPAVFWGIINRGGEQGAQHSQSLHALFSHIPGLKVVMPATPFDAKGLMVAAIRDKNPVVFIDDRWLYGQTGPVPNEIYEVPIGRAIIRSSGTDLTIAAVSYMVLPSLGAVKPLASVGISAEILDLRTVKPLDEKALLASVKKTGRLLVVDGGWITGGFSGEVAARVADRGFRYLKAPIKRIGLPDCPAPASRTLEEAYYPNREDIIKAAKALCSRPQEGIDL